MGWKEINDPTVSLDMISGHQENKIKAEKCQSDTCLENYKTQDTDKPAVC